MLLQWHIKDPSHSAKRTGGRLTLNTNIPLTQQSWSGMTMPSRHSVGTYQGNDFTHNSSPFPLTEPLQTHPGLNRGIGVHNLSSIQNKIQAKAETDLSKLFIPNPCICQEKATATIIQCKKTKKIMPVSIPVSYLHDVDAFPIQVNWYTNKVAVLLYHIWKKKKSILITNSRRLHNK